MNKIENISEIKKVISKGYKNIHSCLIANKSDVLSESYFDGDDGKYCFKNFTREDLHEIRSCTKSILSIMMGICLDKGVIKSVDEPISNYFHNYSLKDSGLFNKITIKHLLTMTSGIKWAQSGTRSKNDLDSEIEMEKSKEPIKYILSQQIESEPGSQFVYNSGNSVLLGKIIEMASDNDLDNFCKNNLFLPLEITNYKWWKPVNGTYWAHAGLLMRPIDLLKIGQILLNNGKWDSKRIISKKYIEEMSSTQEVNKGYGYHFWRKTFDVNDKRFHSFFGAGNGGQYMFVFPFDDLVIVFTGGNYHSVLQDQVFDIINKEILPIV